MMAEPSMPDRRPSPGLSLELNSNNPFRNRASSPGFPSPNLQTPTSAGSRPMSRNPFLQTFEAEFNKEAQLIDMSATMKESPQKASFGDDARQLFDNLTLDDGEKRRPPPGARVPPPRSNTRPTSDRRPSRSDEEDRDRDRRRGDRPRDDRARDDRPRDDRPRGPPRGHSRPTAGSGSTGARPPPRGSPHRREHSRRPRRNSESSMIDKGSLDPNEERRRRERRRERDERRDRDPKSRSTRVRKPHGLDIIDKLDVSGIYGPSMIHHDGPYDAVQPHRNREKDKRAPMHAFPAGSANNALGGSGPLNDKIDLDRIHGRGAEGFTDFGGGANTWKRPELQDRAQTFGPKDRQDIVHGDLSHGLGTSTFLEGAPASRAAISENQKAAAEGGLGRKKSLAQRFRGATQPRRDFADRPKIMSPEARYGDGRSPTGPLTTGGSLTNDRVNERNPFFDNYDEAYEKKGAAIKVAERDGVTSPTSPGGSRNPLTRAMTAESIGSPPPEPKPQTGGGFLNRVKSLKGGRRPRPERPT